jgi:hypothetical protein
MATSEEIGRKIAERVDLDEFKESVVEWGKAAGRRSAEAVKVGTRRAAVGAVALGRDLIEAAGRAVVVIGAAVRSWITSKPGTIERQIARIAIYGGALLLGLRAVGVIEFTVSGIPGLVDRLTGDVWQTANSLWG